MSVQGGNQTIRELKIMDALNIFGMLTANRISDFSGVAESTVNNKLKEMEEIGLVELSPASTPLKKQWMLTAFGQAASRTFKENNYPYFMIVPENFSESNREKYNKIYEALLMDWHTFEEVRKISKSTKMEAKMFLRYIQYRYNLEEGLSHKKIKYKIFREE
ncbi:TPA: MarR family transcriptional regulator [Methanosarcinaceae archaeon]|nr:MarR family transcriptional regulator [Methanosarcinaceae archaeon]